jgi:hypothetical protein
LPSSSINSAFASPVFSHLLLLCAACFLLLPSFPPWARVTNASASRLLHRRTSATRNTRRRSSPPSPRGLWLPSLPRRRLMIQMTPRGLPWRSGLISRPSSAGSDESEYSSDEEDSLNSSEEGSGGDGGDDDDDGGDGCNTSGVTMARAHLGTKDCDHMW